MTKELENNMEYLIKELHREWNKSGEICRKIGLSLERSKTLRDKLAEKILLIKAEHEAGGINFKRSMRLTKESFIYLRMYRKALELEESTRLEDDGDMFFYPLDKDEYRVYKEVLLNEIRR